MNTTSEINAFSMDPNLLVSVIKAQAGTLSKALLEGIMNSIDAGASRVDVALDEKGFTIEDNGKGFSSADEIKNWFGRFGTKHVEGDAIYGRYRMGRGQMMSFASTIWTSSEFCMTVDIEKSGLSYELSKAETALKGCRVQGLLYAPLDSWGLRDNLSELRKAVKYTPKPVYVNGELFGSSPGRLKNWTYEDDFAYYKVTQESEDLLIYNQGVFVESKGTWRVGLGGVVVSKKPLEVNFARNSILENKCTQWAHIKTKLEQVVMDKLTGAKKLSDNERRFLARKACSSPYQFKRHIETAKLITDPSGRHMPLSALRKFDKFTHIAERAELACAVHGADGTFVVTDALLSRFEVNNLEEFISEMRRFEGVLPEKFELVEMDTLLQKGLGGVETLEQNVLSGKQLAAFKALVWLNHEVSGKLISNGYPSAARKLLLGKHKRNSFVAWTDGASYITANKGHLNLFDKGLDGVLEWSQTLVHEYMHDTDDSESHAHGEVFYRKFHDTLFSGNCLSMATIAQQGLIRYLDELKVQGQPRSRKLLRQLRPIVEMRSPALKKAELEVDAYN